MNCSFCHSHSRAARRMSTDDFSTVLDKLSGHTEYIYYHLMGEPLTHPQLPKFLDMAAERGFKSQITTNGTLLRSRGYDLLSHPIHKINISLHSFEGTDNAAHESYLSDVADFADAASRTGVIVVLRLWNRGFDDGKNDRVLAMLREKIGGEWAENTRGLRLREKLFVEWGERFEWPDKNAPVQGEQFFCYGLRDHFGILCDGSVVPCCLDSDGVITLGNIFENDIEDILGSPRATAMIEAFGRRCASEELCRRCGYAQRFTKK